MSWPTNRREQSSFYLVKVLDTASSLDSKAESWRAYWSKLPLLWQSCSLYTKVSLPRSLSVSRQLKLLT